MAPNALPELPREEVDRITKSYRNVFQDSTEIVGARVLERRSETSKVIISHWQQRNLDTASNLIIERSIITDEYFKTAINVNSVDVSRCILSTFSPSESLKATVSFNQNKFVLDIWSNEKLMTSFDLHELDVHGAVYYNDIFGSLSWSPQEDKIVYVAEKKPSKTAPFYSQTAADQSCDKKGEQYAYEEDWGEQISPKKHSTIIVCDIVLRKISLFSEKISNDDFSAGQVIWDPIGTGVVGVGFAHKPRRLGIVYCSNRPSFIFHATKNEHYEILSDEKMSVSSPRFSPDGKYLVWLQHPHGGPHQSAFALVKCDWETKNITTIVDLVKTYMLTSNKFKFYGIYCSKLPDRCWTPDSKFIIFSTVQIHRINSYAVHVDNQNLWDIGSDDENESTIVFDVTENFFAVGKITSFKQPSVLASVSLKVLLENAFDKRSSWNILTDSTNLNNTNVIVPFTVYNEECENYCYGSYYGPESRGPNSIPVVLFIHGGPHATVSSSYNPIIHFFTVEGFGVVIVNYSGSLGCGNDYVHALPGNIGSLDVKDCYFTLQKAFKKFPWLDNKNVMLFGGSHGGFLVTHLSAQYPNDFKSVVTRNPAVNIPAKIFISDIPDWNAIECGYPYEGIKEIMTNEALWRKMAESSPMYCVRNVKAPTLLLLGNKDIRLPYLLGLSYHQCLKELNIPTKVLMYDDHHGLTSVPVEMDSVINSIIWFKRCMK